MKKTSIVLLLALLLVTPTAKAVIIDGINYQLISEAKGAEVISSSAAYSGDVVIPSSVTYGGVEYRVTSIGERAFYKCYNITSITIPSTMISMGEKAFYDCVSLTAVKISDLAAWCAIGFTGFYSNPLFYARRLYLNDEEIKELAIPDGVASIGSFAFFCCTGFTSVTIPSSVTSIGESAFCDCTGLTSVYISDLTAWCAIKFSGNNSNPLACAHRLYLNNQEITALTIPDGVNTIGNHTFCDCTNLTSVTIPGSVTSIGESTFSYCTGLTTIDIPSSVTSIGGAAFNGCTSLSFVKISDLAAWCEIQFSTVMSNPINYAHKLYLNDEEIKELIIPDGVTGIRNYAFGGLTSLTSVSIPNTVTSLGDRAFYGCIGLTSVNIPNSVTSLGDYAFLGCSGLTSVNIPIGVTEIGQGTFYTCTSLASITIPNGVTEIRVDAFYGCSSLTTVSIGRAIRQIWYNSFAYCPNIIDVYCYADTVPSASSIFIGSYPEYATLHVPASAIADYQATTPWNTFKSIVALDEGTPETPKCATPTISYQNGELTFSCETEGVEFVSEITDTDIRKNYVAKVSLTATYNISVYATRSGYENSDVAYATLCWIEVEPKTEGIEDGIAQVPVRPVMIQVQDGVVHITGAEENQQISIFSTDGKCLGQGISRNGSASISTSLRRGSCAIVRIGEKTVKVIIQ